MMNEKMIFVENRNRAKDIEISENVRTARSGSWSMVGLAAERLNLTNAKAKVMQPFGLCLS